MIQRRESISLADFSLRSYILRNDSLTLLEWYSANLRAQNYAFYRYLIECAQACQHMYEETLDRLRELHEKIGDKERSPLLAILELDSKSPQDRRIKKEDWLRNVEAYWARWGCKGPVVSELEGVVAGDQTKLEAVLALMEERSKSDHVGSLYADLLHRSIGY